MSRVLLLAPALLFTIACSSDGDNPDAVGDLTVAVVSSGTPDADGYTLDVSGQAQRSLAVDDTTLYTALPIDDYTVTLGDVEGGCVVADDAVRQRYVAVGPSNRVEYFVTCP